MEAIANQGGERIPKGRERKRFNALVRVLVSGQDGTAWRHPQTGRQVPWRDRPMLLDNAIAILEAGDRDDIRRALQLAIQRQKDPLPLRSSDEVISAEEEAQHYAGHRDGASSRGDGDFVRAGDVLNPDEEHRKHEAESDAA